MVVLVWPWLPRWVWPPAGRRCTRHCAGPASTLTPVMQCSWAKLSTPQNYIINHSECHIRHNIFTSSSPQTMMSTMLWSPILSRNSIVPSRLSDVQIAILIPRSFSLDGMVIMIMKVIVIIIILLKKMLVTLWRELWGFQSSWSACSLVCPSMSSQAPVVMILKIMMMLTTMMMMMIWMFLSVSF